MNAERRKTTIEVSNVKKLNGAGALRGFASVSIDGNIRIDGFRIVKNGDQVPWVSPPQKEVPSKDGGKPRYFPVVEILDDNLKQQITEAVLAAWSVESK